MGQGNGCWIFILYLIPSLGSDALPKKTNEHSIRYLRTKWEIFFDMIDYNKDGELDSIDIAILEEHAVRLHNLTDNEAIFTTQIFRTAYEVLAFRAAPGVGLNKVNFIGNVTKVYEDDPVAFTAEIRAVYIDLFTLFDTNIDCLISRDEAMIAQLDNSHYDKVADMAYFNSFGEPNGIPVHELIDAWVEFHTDTTEKNVTLYADL